MSDTYGGIEVRHGGNWSYVVRLGLFVTNSSDFSGCLFGVRNYGGYDPLFVERGVPEDVAVDMKRDMWIDDQSFPTWVLWSELKRVNWDEVAPERDERITQYEVRDGQEVKVTKWLNRYPHDDVVRMTLDREPAATVTEGAKIFRRVFLTRRDALYGTDFPVAMKLMETLAERYGDDHVRLTVWFD